MKACTLTTNTMSGFVTLHHTLSLSVYQFFIGEMRIILSVPDAVLKDNGMIHSILKPNSGLDDAVWKINKTKRKVK